MNISLEKTSPVTARLTVKVEESDYKDKVAQELKDLARTRVIPGFRKGHVPMGELQRRYGRQMASDVINHEVYRAVLDYIDKEKLEVLGEPLPVEVKEIDLKKAVDYTFEYDLALAPELDIKLDKSVKIPYYNIAVTDQMVDEQDQQLRRRFGAQVPGEEFEKDALVKGSLMELDAEGAVRTDEDAIQAVSTIVMPLHFADSQEAAKFDGKKVGDKVVFNPKRAAGDNLTELASMLNIDKERAAGVDADFELSISEIIVLKPAELGEELYTNAFGPDKVHDEAEYRQALRDMIHRQLAPNSEELFERDVTEHFVQQFKDIELPAELLKKWLVNRNEDITEENIDKEYALMEPGLRWSLVKERLQQLCEVKVQEADVVAFARMLARQQFAQYGMTNLPDDTLDDYAKHMLADEKTRRSIVTRVADLKLFDAIKGRVDLQVSEVTLDKFREIAGAAPQE